MQINGASVLCADGVFRSLAITIENDRISALGEKTSGQEQLDADSLIALPGFVDTHIHGFHGTEFASDVEDFSEARLGLARLGTTTIAPTVRALPLDVTERITGHIVRQSRVECDGAMLGGIHLEGPFISAVRSGAMKAPDEICSPEAMERLIRAGGGFLKIMTIAPERENAEDVIRYAVGQGMKISIGHTDAAYDEAMTAICAGATRMTHTFNAVRPYDHREPGALGACLLDDRVTCEMISDLIHLASPTMQMIYRLKGADRITLVSDAGKMTGMPDGRYVIDGRVRIVKGNTCRNEEGRLAGSTCTILDGVKNLYHMGIPLAEISHMASANPAKALGLDSVIGTLEAGKRADILLFDRDMNLCHVFAGGKQVK